MKVQQFTLALLALLVAISQLMLMSCGSGNKVVSSSIIQKRKYTKGYHLDFSFKKSNNKIEKELVVKNESKEEQDMDETTLVADNNSSDNKNQYEFSDLPPIEKHIVKKRMLVKLSNIKSKRNNFFFAEKDTLPDNKSKSSAKRVKAETNFEGDEINGYVNSDTDNTRVVLLILLAILAILFICFLIWIGFFSIFSGGWAMG